MATSKVLSGPLAWSGDQLEDATAYTFKLTSADVHEIETAYNIFEGTGLGLEDVARWNFPLPQLGTRLERVAEEIHNGRGFMVISGLDPSRYTTEKSTTFYLGIASYIADKRGLQNSKGRMLSHITSSKLWTSVPMNKRHGIHSNSALPYHNDMGCDILGLQKRHGADTGGSTFVCSATTVFNHLVTTEPDVADTLLATDWPVQINASRTTRYYLGAAFAIHDGRLMCSMDPKRFGPQPSIAYEGEMSDIPELTDEQIYALRRVSEVAREHELRLNMRAGDLLFFNNLALLHRRDAYTDGNETSRHMVRLWLRNTRLGWSIPESMLPPWLAAYGEVQNVTERSYPLEADIKYRVPRYAAGSAAFILE